MNNPKADAALNLSLSLPESLHEKSTSLSAVLTGSVWEILVMASQDLSFLTKQYPQIEVSMLLENFALLRLPPSLIPTVSALPQILYIEMPHYISFEILSGKRSSCITQVTLPPLSLTGNGVLVGFVDSGIDLTHPDFQDSNGNSRVLFLWDQTRDEYPPDGYLFGTEYNNEQINEALQMGKTLSKDESGHGTAAAGIACGNGNASKGRYRGIAPEAELIVVKMRKNKGLYPRTTELISGIDYCIRKALKFNRPLVLNISFGNNYGSHTGNSLSELYLNRVSLLGRISIIAASGNEGASPVHASSFLDQTTTVDFSISERQVSLNVQLWKDYEDEMEIYLESPSGEQIGPLYERLGPQRHLLENTELLIYYGKPGPYQLSQEIYIDFIPEGNYVDSGVWKVLLSGKRVRSGQYFLWLPGGNVLNRGTGFYSPRAVGTLTIPSTAGKVISVGAYDSRQNAYADFSGRGSQFLPIRKPDLAAPGVSISAPVPGGGYATVTGTSFAAPFVSGSAALLMEWGIVKGNDPFLYGEKVKAYLRKGAQSVGGYEEYPNVEVGWGRLCLAESIPYGIS